jgi:hypothetical protein
VKSVILSLLLLVILVVAAILIPTPVSRAGLIIDLSRITEYGAGEYRGPARVLETVELETECAPCRRVVLAVKPTGERRSVDATFTFTVALPSRTESLPIREGEWLYVWALADFPFWWDYQMSLHKLENGESGELLIAAWSADQFADPTWELGPFSLEGRRQLLLPKLSECGLQLPRSLIARSPEEAWRIRSGRLKQIGRYTIWNGDGSSVVAALCSEMGTGWTSGVVLRR